MFLTPSLIKTSVKTGIITAVILLLYELSDLLLIYHYFKFEYYIAVAAILALITGIILTAWYYNDRSKTSTEKDLVSGLTPKELQVLIMISAGKSNKEIATLNFVEISTIKTHINNIYSKLGVKERKSAVEIYRQFRVNSKSTLSPPAII